MSRSAQRMTILIGLWITALGVQSCRFFRAEATFKIKVVDGSGDPLPNSQVIIQKKLMGTTNQRGALELNLELPLNEAILVEINKPSTQMFYAPFFESFRVAKGEPNRFNIQAILYAVPKNSPEVPAEDLTQKAAEVPTESAIAPIAGNPSSTEDPGLVSAMQNLNNDGMVGLPPPSDMAEDPTQKSHNAVIEPFDPELSAQKAANTLLDNPEQNSRLITFYTASGRENVTDARILYGDPERGQWLEGCTTNARGRCSFTLPASFRTENVHLLTRATNYQPQIKIISLAHGDKIRIDLIRGQSLEIFAVQKNYRSIRGLKSVGVKLAGKEIGRTDSFGYLSYSIPQKPAESIAVTMEATGYLPSSITQTISNLGPWTLVQSFSGKESPRARLLLLPLKIQNSGSESPPANIIMSWDKIIQDGIRQNLMSQPPFMEADWERISLILERNGLSLQQLGRQGWNQADLTSEFEWALRPTLILGPSAALELSLINANGQIQGASLQRLTIKPDSQALRALLAVASREISSFLPFEGSLVEAEREGFRINLNQQSGHALKVGESLRLHGLMADFPNSPSGWTDIGSARVTELGDSFARIRVQELKPRSTASIGQIVVLNRGMEAGDKYITVIDQGDKRPLAQANLFLQDQWIGTTDRQGIARIGSSAAGRRGVLSVVRSGYRILQDDFSWVEGKDKSLALQRSSIPLRIETDPSNAQIKLNGRLIGRSPLYQSIDPPGPTAQIEIILNEEYKPLNQVISFDEEGLDWSGARAVHLEKDLRREAKQLIQVGRLSEAIHLLEALPESHPDFLIVQHELGDIYLNQSQDPIKAAAAFHRVTSRPEVAQFVDKRFIGTYINEAIAIYHIGEKMKVSDQAAALSSWQQTKDMLDRCEDQLRFIPEEQYTQAVHSLSYYRALSLHRIWGLTQKAEDLRNAHNSWKKYIESTALASPADKHYSLLKKAELFYRQTQGLAEPSEQARLSQPQPTTTKAL